MTTSLGTLLYSCSLFGLHQPADDPLTDLASSSFVLFVHFGFGIFFPSYDM